MAEGKDAPQAWLVARMGDLLGFGGAEGEDAGGENHGDEGESNDEVVHVCFSFFVLWRPLVPLDNLRISQAGGD